MWYRLDRQLAALNIVGPTRWYFVPSLILLIAHYAIGDLFVPYLGLVPAAVLKEGWVWQPFTYLFLHGGFLHWLFDIFLVAWLGRDLEIRWGRSELVKYFFLTGVAAAAFSLIFSPTSLRPIIGASGATLGLLVGYAMAFPDRVFYFYGLFPIRVWHAAVLVALIKFFSTLDAGGSGLARFGDLGGMAIGYLYLRFGWKLKSSISAPLRPAVTRIKETLTAKPRSKIELHEITDDTVEQVDRILDKISKSGIESLTAEEKRIMDRYSSRLKR